MIHRKGLARRIALGAAVLFSLLALIVLVFARMGAERVLHNEVERGLARSTALVEYLLRAELQNIENLFAELISVRAVADGVRDDDPDGVAERLQRSQALLAAKGVDLLLVARDSLSPWVQLQFAPSSSVAAAPPSDAHPQIVKQLLTLPSGRWQLLQTPEEGGKVQVYLGFAVDILDPLTHQKIGRLAGGVVLGENSTIATDLRKAIDLPGVALLALHPGQGLRVLACEVVDPALETELQTWLARFGPGKQPSSDFPQTDLKVRVGWTLQPLNVGQNLALGLALYSPGSGNAGEIFWLTVLGVGLAGGLAILLLYAMLRRELVLPLNQLATDAGQIMAGKTRPLQVPRPHAEDEIGSLAESFNALLERIEGEKQHYRGILESANVVSWEAGADFTFSYVSSHAERLFGYPLEQWLQPGFWVDHLHPLDRNRAATICSSAVARNEDHEFEYRMLHANGETLWVRDIVTVLLENGQFVGLRGVLVDITGQKEAEERIRTLAFFDPLTELPNRRLLLDRLGHAQIASARSGNMGGVVFIDLDEFKILNDVEGREVGDQLLIDVAQRLRASVGDIDTVARLGGDEFALVLEDLHVDWAQAAEKLERVAEKLLASLNQPYRLGDRVHYSSPSIGLTLFEGPILSGEELLKRAELAMYRAKEAGRNTVRFFDPQMQARIEERATLEEALRTALHEEQFVLHYQPQIDRTGRPLGAEALVRWQHPERGLIYPGEFISLAEETGLILHLGLRVLTEACRQLKRWADLPHLNQLRVAVNISARQFRQPNFVSQTRALVLGAEIDPALLKLEITESLMLEDLEDTVHKMNELRELGLCFAIDDFGTGYSSLAYLKRLPLQELKIDQSFVRDIGKDRNDEAIARAIIAMARSLGLHITAEGVETAEQFAFLANEGCDQYQGYLFSRPIPAAEFESWALRQSEAGS